MPAPAAAIDAEARVAAAGALSAVHSDPLIRERVTTPEVTTHRSR